MAYQLFKITSQCREILFRADLTASSPVELREFGQWVSTGLTTPDCGTDPTQIANAIGERPNTFQEEGEEWAVFGVDDPTKVWNETTTLGGSFVHRSLADGTLGVAGTPGQMDWIVTHAWDESVRSVTNLFGKLSENQATMLAELLAAEQALMHQRQPGEIAFKEGE